MELDAIEIDRIVREVVRRLGDRSVAAVQPEDAETCTDAATLVVDRRLVTARDLEGRLDGIRRLRVSANAVVTPLVKDLLRDAAVELTRDEAGEPLEKPAAACLLVESGWNPSLVVDRLSRVGSRWRTVSTWDDLMHEVTSGNTRGAACTADWAARVCQANRLESVRAAYVVDALAVPDAVRQINANLLIVNARQTSEAVGVEILGDFAPSSATR